MDLEQRAPEGLDNRGSLSRANKGLELSLEEASVAALSASAEIGRDKGRDIPGVVAERPLELRYEHRTR